jgi:hypothetical protein
MLMSGIVAFAMNRIVKEEQQEVIKLQALAAQLQINHRELQRLHMDVLAKQRLVEDLGDGRLPAAPAWLLGYLSEALPPDLLLTNLQVRLRNDHWQVRMSGAMQPTTNAQPDLIFSQAINLFSNRLVQGPFQFQITNSAAVLPRSAGGAAPFGDFLRLNTTAAQPAKPSHFEFIGSMQ